MPKNLLMKGLLLMLFSCAPVVEPKDEEDSNASSNLQYEEPETFFLESHEENEDTY